MNQSSGLLLEMQERIEEIQKNLSKNIPLSHHDIENLFLYSLLKEEGHYDKTRKQD